MWTASQASFRFFRPLRPFPALALAAAALSAGCAHQSSSLTSSAEWQQTLTQWSGASVILLGEQHDQSAHHQWEAETVSLLAGQQRLAALVIEMAPAGGNTATLPATASEEQSAASQEVTCTISNVSLAARESAQTMAEAAQAVIHLAQQADTVENLVEQLRNNK